MDQMITCPSCNASFALTDSLAGPLLEATRREFEERLAKKDADIAVRLEEQRARIAQEEAAKAKATIDADLALKQSEIATLHETLKQRNDKLAEAQKLQAELTRQRQALEDEKAEFESTIAEKLRGEREKIAADAERKTRLALEDDMNARAKEVADLNAVLDSQRVKLFEAQNAQAELLKKQRELEDAKAQMQLDIQKGIQEGLDASRALAKKEAEDALGLKLAESQHTISSMQKQIEELKRKAEQGSQQIQGEVLEIELESRLAAQFPMDIITPVPKGQFGGDCTQTVRNPIGQPCGTIIWESKNTKAWSDGWLQKLKDDQRTAKAEIAVIITQALPKNIETFGDVDGVWVTSPACAIPVASCLRQTLIELSLMRSAGEGQETKMQMVYDYLTGPHFRQRVLAIVEAFSVMQDDLAKEKRAIQLQWAKREKQLERVTLATVGMYGDLQGIAGKSLQEIEGLTMLAHEDGEDVSGG